MRRPRAAGKDKEEKLPADQLIAGKTFTGRGDNQTISYTAERVIGNGSFGVVFQATVVGTGEVVAIKKVLQDKRFKNRELQIMRTLDHSCIVQLKHCFYSSGEKVGVFFFFFFSPPSLAPVCLCADAAFFPPRCSPKRCT